MDIDRKIDCNDCKHHEKPSCKRIKYDESYRSIGKFAFKKKPFSSHPDGWICSDFEIWEGNLNSPSYKDFTLEDWMIYWGIHCLEHKILTSGHVHKRIVGDYVFEITRGYDIYKVGQEPKHYRYFHTWTEGGAYDDWLDICRAMEHTEEYIKEAKDAFLHGSVSIVVPNDKGWYKMRYKDFFYGDVIREDGKLDVYKYYWYTVPRSPLPYVLHSRYVDGLALC